MKAFKDNRSVLWLAGVIAMVLGILAAFVVLPATSQTNVPDGPDINVPNMENVPPAGAPKLGLEVQKEGD